MKKTFLLSLMLGFCSIIMAQNVTIIAQNQPASAVFRSIIGQTGKNFVYSSELLKDMRVTINVKDKPLKEALSIMFRDSDIEWRIKGKNIILKRRPKPEKQKYKPTVNAPSQTIENKNSIEPKMLEEVVVTSRLEAPAVEAAEIGAKKVTAGKYVILQFYSVKLM